MADRKRKMTTGAKYVAVGALTEAIDAAGTILVPGLGSADTEAVARSVIDQAWDVEFFPNAGRVTITLDVNQLVNGGPTTTEGDLNL